MVDKRQAWLLVLWVDVMNKKRHMLLMFVTFWRWNLDNFVRDLSKSDEFVCIIRKVEQNALNYSDQIWIWFLSIQMIIIKIVAYRCRQRAVDVLMRSLCCMSRTWTWKLPKNFLLKFDCKWNEINSFEFWFPQNSRMATKKRCPAPRKT